MQLSYAKGTDKFIFSDNIRSCVVYGEKWFIVETTKLEVMFSGPTNVRGP